MPSRFGRAPYGYLGALDLKQQGQNPESIGDQIQSSIDVGPYYYQPLVVQLNSIAPGPMTIADGTQVALTVPAGKAWLVYALSGALGLNATDTIRDQGGVYIGYRPNAIASDMALAVGEQYAPRVVVAAQTLRAAMKFDTPMLVPSGALLIARTTASFILTGAGALVVAALVFEFTA